MERNDRNSEICVDVPLHGGLVEVEWESLVFRLKIEDFGLVVEEIVSMRTK